MKKFSGPPARADQLKIFAHKSERMTPGCRVTGARYERVNMYKQQIVKLLRDTRTYAT
jgi:hypothetical protein